MYVFGFQFWPLRRQTPPCVLFALALGGWALAATVQGAISADVSTHIPLLPPLLISSSAGSKETKAFERSGLSPLNVKFECPLSGTTYPTIKLDMHEVFLQPKLTQTPLQVNAECPLPPNAGPLFDFDVSPMAWPNATQTQTLTMENGAPGERVRIANAARVPVAPYTEHSLTSLRHTWKAFTNPLVVEFDTEHRTPVKSQPRPDVTLVGTSDMPLGLLDKQPLSVQPQSLASDLGHAMRAMPPEPMVVLSADYQGHVKALDQRLVAGVLDEAEHGNHSKLEGALKKELLAVVAHGTSTESAYRAFLTLLAGSMGTNDLERGERLLTWTERAGTTQDLNRLVYFMALHRYRSFKYAAALNGIDQYLDTRSKEGSWDGKDQFLMLKALCAWGEGNDGASAITVLNEMLAGYPDSPLVPHAIFLRAWVSLYCGRTGEARAGFGEVVSKHPQSEFAGRARQVLKGLPAGD